MSPFYSAPKTSSRYFAAGLVAAARSVFAYVLFATYVGIGALGHDFGFSLLWTAASTILVWAGPAQVILISTLGAGGALIETAVAVALSGVRLLPMVASLLPMLKGPATRLRSLILPAHFTAVSMWIESFRLIPSIPRDHRIAFCNGLGCGLLIAAMIGTVTGFYLAGSLPQLLSAALLFLTPLSFFYSTVRNSRELVDVLAFVLGAATWPLLAAFEIGLDLLWSGLIGGSVAYAIHQLRRTLR